MQSLPSRKENWRVGVQKQGIMELKNPCMYLVSHHNVGELGYWVHGELELLMALGLMPSVRIETDVFGAIAKTH